MSEVLILKKRKDFVRVAAKGVKVATSTLILQAAQSLSAPEGSCRTGYTTTKKIGKAHPPAPPSANFFRPAPVPVSTMF